MAATPQDAQRRTPGAPDSTKPAHLAASSARTPTHAVTGPAAWENGRDATSTPAGPPSLRGTAASDADPTCQVTQTVGMNPNPPDVRSASTPADTNTPVVAGSPTGFTPFMNQY
ncbi:hypothetical protein [Streptacidiphilus carbonis]|uniref:hypothetical protein n=1 Tax=Streptacidiphilus carbonis TaxID=105422 RepID=UPI0005A725F1|nr:hypothetical protein [Streptacidiphilus carbonis]